MKKLLTISLLLFACAAVPAQTMSQLYTKAESNSNREIEKGTKALDAKKLREARKHFNKAIKLFDINYQAYAYLGILDDMEQRPQDAVKQFEKSLAMFEKYKAHLIERKTDYIKEMERKALSLQVELDQHDMQYQGGNAMAAETKKTEMMNKVKNLSAELEKDKEMKYPAFFRFKYGNALMKVRNVGSARQQYQLAVDTDPELVDAYVNLSVACFMTNDCASAMKTYEAGKARGAKFPPRYVQDLMKRCGGQ